MKKVIRKTEFGLLKFKNTTAVTSKTVSVYVLRKDDEVIYVGQSTNLESRIKQHCLDKDFDSVDVIECSQDNLLSLEKHYIKELRPLLNIAHNEDVETKCFIDTKVGDYYDSYLVAQYMGIRHSGFMKTINAKFNKHYVNEDDFDYKTTTYSREGKDYKMYLLDRFALWNVIPPQFFIEFMETAFNDEDKQMLNESAQKVFKFKEHRVEVA